MIDISVVIDTELSYVSLPLMLHALNCQNYRQFQVIIVHDITIEKDIKDLIFKLKSELFYNIQHLGSNSDVTSIQQLITYCDTDYIMFLKTGCIPSRYCIETHVKYRQRYHFITSGSVKLYKTTYNAIDSSAIYKQSCFNKKWLKQNGFKRSLQNVCTRIFFNTHNENEVTALSFWKLDVDENSNTNIYDDDTIFNLALKHLLTSKNTQMPLKQNLLCLFFRP